MPLQPFHVAFPVDDIAETRKFYEGFLGCGVGRTDDTWIDFDMFGHQVVAHLRTDGSKGGEIRNPVDGHDVPVPHFGVVLDMDAWEKLAARLKAAKIKFVIEPYIKFKGQPGEQATMFFYDPSGNALEFKAFKDIKQLFAT